MWIVIGSCVVRDKIKNCTSLFLPWMSKKSTKGLIAFTLEIECNQTAKDLPPVKYAVLLIAK
jgi:hypothetical protein